MTSRFARLALGLVVLTAMVSGTVSAADAPQDAVEPVGATDAIDGDGLVLQDYDDGQTGGYDCGPNNTYSVIVGGCVYTG